MADICVVYLSEDEAVVRKLVDLLREDWDTWYALDIAHGDWEQTVRSQISNCLALVPVLSQYVTGEREAILRDEMRLAKSLGKPILPFRINAGDVPFGFGGLNHTCAFGWLGDEGHKGYRQLKEKISKTIASSPESTWRAVTAAEYESPQKNSHIASLRVLPFLS